MEDLWPFIGVIGSLLAIVLLLAKPFWGVIALFIVRPIVDTTWAQPLIFNLKLTELVSTIVPLIVFARMIVDDDGQRPFADMPLKWIWVVWSVDVLLFSSTIMFSQGLMDGLAVLMRHLNGLTGFYMLQAYCRNERDFHRFAWALAVAGVFPIATGVFEGVTGAHWRITAGEGGVTRNIGLYHDAITIRYYALQTILGLLLIGATGEKKSTPINILCLAYGAAAVFVIKGAYSKSGLLTLASWLFLWPLLRNNVKAIFGVVALVSITALYYSKEIMDSVGFVFVKEIAAVQGQVGVERTFAGRWYIWIDMMQDWRSLGAFSQLFGAGHVASGAHNDYLQILFHGGIVGLAIYSLLLIAAAWLIARALVVRRRDVFSVAALLVFIMWIIDTIGLVPSAYSGYQWFVWGIIGFGLRVEKGEKALASDNGAAYANKRFQNLMGIA
jgi:hypothetical protein